jgi:hypothetical protein
VSHTYDIAPLVCGAIFLYIAKKEKNEFI